MDNYDEIFRVAYREAKFSLKPDFIKHCYFNAGLCVVSIACSVGYLCLGDSIAPIMQDLTGALNCVLFGSSTLLLYNDYRARKIAKSVTNEILKEIENEDSEQELTQEMPENADTDHEIIQKAILLKAYADNLGIEGYDNVLDSIISKTITEDEKESYEMFLETIANNLYNRALTKLNMEGALTKEDVLTKAIALKNYILDINYDDASSDLSFLEQAIEEYKNGNVSLNDFNSWIHYIGNNAYNNALNYIGQTR